MSSLAKVYAIFIAVLVLDVLVAAYLKSPGHLGRVFEKRVVKHFKAFG